DLLSYVSPKEAWLDGKVSSQMRTKYPVITFPDGWPGQANVPQQVVVAEGQNSWSIFFHLEDPKWIWTAHLLILFIMFLFTIGFATRITSVLTFMGAICYIWRAQTSLFGLDAIIVVVLFYLMIAPGGAALSVDRWLEVRRERRRLRN